METRPVFLCLSAIVLLFATSNVNCENLILGRRNYDDRLLYQQLINVPSRLMRVVTIDVNFPSDGRTKGPITFINGTDLNTKGNGAIAHLTSGGVESKVASFHVKSMRGHSISFMFEIYGRLQ